MKGTIIETFPNLGYFRLKREDSKVFKITLDDYHLELPFKIHDTVLINEDSNLLFFIPVDNESVKNKIKSNINSMSVIFSDILIKSAENYISKNNYMPNISRDKILSSFFNILCWKDYYYNLYGNNLRDIIGKSIPLKDCTIFINYWLNEHLFRQFNLWGFTMEEAKILIEDLMITNSGKECDIEDLIISLFKCPGRYMYIHKDLDNAKLERLEKISGVETMPLEVKKLKRKLFNEPKDSYIMLPENISHYDLNKYGLTIFDNNTKVSLNSVYKIEEFVSKHIQIKIKKSNYDWKDNKIKFKLDHSELSEDQLDGLSMALQCEICIITGGPGTGKTKLIYSLIKESIARGIKYHVTAFTGKAVGRVKETAHPEQIEGSTMDMMFTRGPNHYDFQLLIIEESSMITTKYMYNLFKRFNPLCYKIVMVGDLNQIPPIEKGHFLSSIIWSKRVPYIRLNKNFRVDQKFGGDIIVNSQRIIDPIRPLNVPVELDFNSNSFKILQGDYNLLKTILRKIQNLNDLTILTPYNTDVNNINKMFQSIKYSSKDEYIGLTGGVRWYVDDRIMVIENDNSIDLANGDLGTVREIQSNQVEFVLDKDGTQRCFDLVKASQKLKHSYAFTINKSQGSEYPIVVLYIPDNSSNDFFLNMNMIYTAITRARKMVWIITENVESLFRSCNKTIPLSKDFLKESIIKKFPDREYTSTLVEREEIDDYGEEEYDYDDDGW